MTVCCLTSQSIHLFPSSAVSVWSNNDSLSKLLLRSLSSEAGLCIRWKWLLLPLSLDKFCYKLEAVCMHIALMAGWSAGWWGGDSSEQQQSPQALLFCLTLSRTHTTWCPHRARLCTRGCVCVCGSKKPPLGDRLQKMKLFLQCIETTKVLPMFLVYV